MKKIALAAFAFVSLTAAEAQLPQTFIQVLQSFAQDNRLIYIPETPNQGDYITYKFSSDASCQSESCADLKVYYSIDPNCVPASVGLFGELPVSIPGDAKALFISPTISDVSSQARDFLRVQVKGGCYELSMGEKGSHFKTLVDLANRLATAK